MSHRFHFSRESRDRVNGFHTGDDPTQGSELLEQTIVPGAEETATVAPGVFAAEEKRRKESGGYETVSRTDIGRVRSTNQDAVIEAGCLVGVADGMGGHQGGETASDLARSAVVNRLEGLMPNGNDLVAAVRVANRRVYARSCEDESLRGMGTTLTLMWLGVSYACIAHVGDSRCYLLREGTLRCMTEDHSYVMQLVLAGLITREEAARHPMRNVITRAVGTETYVEVDTLQVQRKKGDIYLICSDGLHGMVTEKDMLETLSADKPLGEMADTLLNKALEAGGHDNISLVLLRDTEGAQ